MRVLFVLFVLMPILEMVVLIKVGGIIGALPTVGLVLLTAMIGVALLRQQGLNTLARAQDKMRSGQLPASEMVEGLFLAVGGALLLTPGFITDAIGFACLMPGIRHLLFIAVSKGFASNARFYRAGSTEWEGYNQHANQNQYNSSKINSAPRGTHQSETLEGEYSRED